MGLKERAGRAGPRAICRSNCASGRGSELARRGAHHFQLPLPGCLGGPASVAHTEGWGQAGQQVRGTAAHGSKGGSGRQRHGGEGAARTTRECRRTAVALLSAAPHQVRIDFLLNQLKLGKLLLLQSVLYNKFTQTIIIISIILMCPSTRIHRAASACLIIFMRNRKRDRGATACKEGNNAGGEQIRASMRTAAGTQAEAHSARTRIKEARVRGTELSVINVRAKATGGGTVQHPPGTGPGVLAGPCNRALLFRVGGSTLRADSSWLAEKQIARRKEARAQNEKRAPKARGRTRKKLA